jgi:ankyrin repeat protein
MNDCDLSQSDLYRRTPLHLAAGESQFECVKFLVDKAKVSINVIDKFENSPLDDIILSMKKC